MKKRHGELNYSPSDLVTFLASPFASWMDRYHLENPGSVIPDKVSEDLRLIFEIGNQHERAILEGLKSSTPGLVEIPRDNDAVARTREALDARSPIIYQAKLESGNFAGYADFMILNEDGRYQIWDTKLARSPKPSYPIQLCCYSEMFAASTGEPMPDKFGIILGADEHGVSERLELRVEDFIHYYRYLKQKFLELQANYDGDFNSRPEPHPTGEHGRWATHADRYLNERDHLVRVAGISTGQIKKLQEAGITTLAELAASAGRRVAKIPPPTMDKLVHQARLQKETRELRRADKKAMARYEILPTTDELGQLVGLGALPPEHPGDVFFDMEGYPLMPGGLEYLFGNTTIDPAAGEYEFTDFWAHDRSGEKEAFESFIDWVYERWLRNPGMHIYHYAAYEVSAVRRLSTLHDTRQDQVDNLLRQEVFVDLYKIVRRGLRIGEESYSLKKVERLYWPDSRTGVVTLSIGSVVHYARWIQSGESPRWEESPILKEIRDYNKDDCDSTAELAKWLRQLAADNGITPADDQRSNKSLEIPEPEDLAPEVAARLELIEALRAKDDKFSTVLADLVDFHRREAKPIWWRMFDRADSEPEVLRDDNGCISEVEAVGDPVLEKRSLIQQYQFDPSQECKIREGSKVMFTHYLKPKLELLEIDLSEGRLVIKTSQKTLDEHFGGSFPTSGSLIPDEYVNPKPIPAALTSIAARYMAGDVHTPLKALLGREAPSAQLAGASASVVEDAVRISREMSGGCLVIQGPPGTGKTFTASNMISGLLEDGKRVGITSNSHKAINNLLRECGRLQRKNGKELEGIRVGGGEDDEALIENPNLQYVSSTGAIERYAGGVVGGTAWLFTKDEWEGQLDFLFVDEAGQVPLANVVAMLRSTRNLVLLGDQMQLEQPTQGSHPGDSALSALQYALKDEDVSLPDSPVFYAVVPSDYGLFLGESRRMHPDVCQFISESVYEGRLSSFEDCANQRIVPGNSGLITLGAGIVFAGVEHDGNTQRSDEEVEVVTKIYRDLLGRPYTSKDGTTRPLAVSDFLFISPYNAQVRALQQALPSGAKVGSVDLFQGQEAPVCILSLCSSFGEYGSRGLGFILDQNRVNVAISRAQCLSVVVADPRIASTQAGSLTEMKLLNLFCKLVMLNAGRE